MDPTFPVVVPNDQVQEMGVVNEQPVYQSHRGPKPGQYRYTDSVPPAIPTDDTFIRPTS